MGQDIVVLTSNLYGFLQAAERLVLSKRQTTHEATQRLLVGAQELSNSFSEAGKRTADQLSSAIDDVSRSLNALTERIRRWASEPAGDAVPSTEVRSLWKRLGQSYEALVAQIKLLHLKIPDGVRLAHVKPRNLYRNLFHVGMGMGAVVFSQLVKSQALCLIVTGAATAFFIFLDVLRRVSPVWNDRLVKRILGKISRPSEAHRVPSATWYTLALFLGVLLTPQHAIEVGVLALCWGDPIASLAGKRWGSVKLFRDKSLAGTVAFFIISFVAIFIFWVFFVAGSTVGGALLIALAVGATGAITELYSVWLDDNLTIPLVCAAMAALLMTIL